jgi:tetratricopeptide (TPR) repeat protein
VPRFLKLLSAISFPDKKIQLIALGGGDSLVKQSPTHEETGLGIFRVPTFIIYKNGQEINRINEFPVFSLEQDLLTILHEKPYSPNYHSFETVLQWLNDGSLTDDNNSIRGLAEQLRPLVADEHELNSLGYLLLKQGKKKEALQIFRMNYTLYPESSNIASSLGEGYYENGDHKKAVSFLERSLELNKDPKAIKDILMILYKAKEKEKI